MQLSVVVVKNVASTSFEVRKLVYIYLLRYAEQEPDLALLSINTFQKGEYMSHVYLKLKPHNFW